MIMTDPFEPMRSNALLLCLQAVSSSRDPQAIVACLQVLLMLTSATAAVQKDNKKATRTKEDAGRGFLLDPMQNEKLGGSSRHVIR